MKWCLVTLFLAVVSLATSADDDSARILVSKNILNQVLVEGHELTVQYNIYNVGGSSALKVQLTDNSFPSSDFDILEGSLDVKWPRIPPGSNVTHATILKPLRSGYFNFTAAEISYFPTEDSTQPQLGYSSSPGEGGIMNSKDYDRKYSSHMLDWAAFATMTLPSLGIPFLLWYSSKSKYEQPRPAGKKAN